MNIENKKADFYIPDGESANVAVSRTTQLSIAAHQDDIEFMSFHGILDCFEKKDQWFSGVTVTDGAGSSRSGSYADKSDKDMVEIRKIEQRKAAFLGEYGFQLQLGYTSAEVKLNDEKITKEIAAILEAANPEIVYSHNPFDKHDTHVAVFFHTLDALRSLPKNKRPSRFFGCECWRGLDWINDEEKVVWNVSERPALGPALAGVFDSQIAGGKRYDLAATGRRQANATYLESHACDKSDLVQYAIDMTSLIEDDNLTVQKFVKKYLLQFQDDVLKRTKKYSW